mmetsp:Transcript_7059/g.12807  ORF Transcript_7059/g.12807 Transcript_7059/m.12807 type:complete len:225 (-) Transcript_7059:151-825(-)
MRILLSVERIHHAHRRLHLLLHRVRPHRHAAKPKTFHPTQRLHPRGWQGQRRGRWGHGRVATTSVVTRQRPKTGVHVVRENVLVRGRHRGACRRALLAERALVRGAHVRRGHDGRARGGGAGVRAEPCSPSMRLPCAPTLQLLPLQMLAQRVPHPQARYARLVPAAHGGRVGLRPMLPRLPTYAQVGLLHMSAQRRLAQAASQGAHRFGADALREERAVVVLRR